MRVSTWDPDGNEFVDRRATTTTTERATIETTQGGTRATQEYLIRTGAHPSCLGAFARLSPWALVCISRQGRG